jgi:hypothetical protein
MANPTVKDNTILFANGKVRILQAIIREFIYIDEYIIVRIDSYLSRITMNVYCFDFDGILTWQIDYSPNLNLDCPYVGMYYDKDNDELRLRNWCDYYVYVDHRTGKFIRQKEERF